MINTLKLMGQFIVRIIVDVFQIAGCLLELVIMLLWRGLLLYRMGLKKLIDIFKLYDYDLSNCWTRALFGSICESWRKNQKADKNISKEKES